MDKYRDVDGAWSWTRKPRAKGETRQGGDGKGEEERGKREGGRREESVQEI